MLTEATSSPSTIKQAINSPELASVEDGIPGQHIIFIFLTYFKYAKEKNGYLPQSSKHNLNTVAPAWNTVISMGSNTGTE